MPKKSFHFAVFTLLACSFASLAAVRGLAQEQVQTDAEIVQEISHDTSPPVSSMPLISPRPHQATIPLHRKPGLPIVAPGGFDEALQTLPMARVGTSNLVNRDGISDRDGVAPPDTNASVGATQVVETVNTSYQVFSKSTGAAVFGPAEISSIFTGLAGPCGVASNFFSDPVVLYDKAAGRWLVTIIASTNGSTFIPGVHCIAVSKTNNATGAYFRYSFAFGNNVPDYPKLGVWPDAYYASYNMFSGPTSFVGAKVCAYNRAKMLVGTKGTAVCFQRSPSSDFSLLPSDLDGATAPASGTPNFFLELATATTLKFFKFHVNFAGGSTFSGPTTLTVASFSEACGGGTCIPQSGTTTKLDSLGDRLMFRLAYRKLSTQESLLVSHSVKPTTGPVSAVRWYEIRNPSSTPSVFQQGTFVVSGKATWMPSIGMDKMGNIALGFSQSSSTTHPGIAYTGRAPTDPAGTMQSAFTVITGGGSQTGGLSRWGDYSSMSIDPQDDCTFWYANEYIPSNGNFNWHTRLNSFRFANCP
jgi:hypothetical protein